MSLLDLSSSSHRVILLLLKPNPLNTDALRRTNSKFNTIGVSLNLHMIDNAVISMRCRELDSPPARLLRTFDLVVREYRIESELKLMEEQNTGDWLWWYDQKNYSTILLDSTFDYVQSSNPDVKFISTFNRMMKRVRSIKRLEFRDWRIFGKSVKLLCQWKNELSTVTSVNFDFCRLPVDHGNFLEFFGLMNVKDLNMFETWHRFKLVDSMLWKLRRFHYTNYRSSYQLTDALLKQWCFKNMSNNIQLQYMQTVFTFKSIMDFIQALFSEEYAKKTKLNNHFFELGNTKITKEELRYFIGTAQRASGIRWKMFFSINTYFFSAVHPDNCSIQVHSKVRLADFPNTSPSLPN